jgi:metallo-beta-lactamase family protein
MSAHLQFLGATGTVTGSRYLIDTGTHRVLIDCGLFQGYKQLRLRNWTPPPFDPASIDAVLLTHAHLDHSGYLPRLVKLGFRGVVHATHGTAELCGVLLPDSGRLQEEDAHFANQHGTSRHHPALPLYDEDDARVSLRRLVPMVFGQEFEPVPRLTCRLAPAGHLLGAASVHVQIRGGSSVLFSGDLGRAADPVMRAPAPPMAADRIVVESTYGNRRHAALPPHDELAPIINAVAHRGGVILIPTFAVGRAQSLLLVLRQLREAGRIARLPTFLDSPMAIDATVLYELHGDEHRLDAGAFGDLREMATLVRTPSESKALMQRSGPMIVLAASGMATGGRVLHHLKALAPEPRNAIVLAGYQAGGTRGAAIARGDTTVRIHGQPVPIRAEVHQLHSMSAHADGDELLDWLRAAPRPPREVFVTHGEPDAADALRLRIETEIGWNASVPDFRDRVAL